MSGANKYMRDEIREQQRQMKLRARENREAIIEEKRAIAQIYMK